MKMDARRCNVSVCGLMDGHPSPSLPIEFSMPPKSRCSIRSSAVAAKLFVTEAIDRVFVVKIRQKSSQSSILLLVLSDLRMVLMSVDMIHQPKFRSCDEAKKRDDHRMWEARYKYVVSSGNI
jgi:hypothetical protein